jgi:hypothetical protein
MSANPYRGGVGYKKTNSGEVSYEVSYLDVNFEFAPDAKVKTVLGEIGIVDMCAIDNNGNEIYYVKTLTGGNWFKKGQLKKQG